jgi:hypothetical protein
LQHTSAPMRDSDKRASNAKKINTGLRQRFDEFKLRWPPTAIERLRPAACYIYHSLHRTKPAGRNVSGCSPLALVTTTTLTATLLPREPVAFCFPFWHRRGGRQGPLPVRMRV